MKSRRSVMAMVAVLFLIPRVWAASPPELELVDGPKMVVLTQKGAMLKVLQIQEMLSDRAHQLKFTFFPAIKDDSVKLKLYRSDDASGARELKLRGGRSALVDLDPGPSGLQVMLEEQGVLEQSTRIFASLYRYPLGSEPAVSAAKPAAPVVPDKLVTVADGFDGLLKKERRTLTRTMTDLGVTEGQARSFLVSMANVRGYIGKKDLSAAEYFLDEAQKTIDCAEVWYWRALAFGVFDLDRAQTNIEQAFERFDGGRTAAALFGDSTNESKARCHILAANLLVRQAQANPRQSDAEIAADEDRLNVHLTKAADLDHGQSKEPASLLRKKWQELLVARKAILDGTAAPTDGSAALPTGVHDFLEARKCFVEKKFPEALKMLDSLPDLPEADAQYLRAEILLQLGRREGARKALEKSIADFEAGRCLAGKDGGAVLGAQGSVPPAASRAALARVSLARYWAERFKREQTEDPTKAPSEIVPYLETAITLMEQAIEAAPSYKPWQAVVNTYRDERLRILYPGFTGPIKR